MGLWQSDEELFDLARRELFTGVVGDAMDRIGLQRQFLPPEIRPLQPDMVVIGRAMTVLEADVFTSSPDETTNETLKQPFGLMLHALDDLKPGEVYVCAGASPRYALWGELMSTRAQKLGAHGAVLDGYYRDTKAIMELGFPTFGYGSYAQDQGPRGKVIDFRVPIAIGQAEIRPGDILFGDLDGVCVVPRASEEEVFSAALEKVRSEERVRRAIVDGMSTVDAWKEYGVM